MNTAAAQYQQASDTLDREKLILGNIDYVRQVFSTMAVNIRDEDERENLYSAGIVGLVQAANKYEPHREASFRTFAFPRIRGAIIDELRKIAPVSQKVLQQIGMIKKVHERLEPPVTPELLALHTGMTIEEVHSSLEAMRFLKPQDWNDFHSVIHSSWKTDAHGPEYRTEQAEIKKVLADGIESLEQRERIVLTLYFTDELTLAEIGEVLKLSESRVSRILSAAKFNLQEYFRARTS